jgi:hypothetical protein
MYVLTEGWYEDMAIKGVTDSKAQAEEWAAADTYRDYYGPFERGELPA